ncbi:HD domain-containing protein [Nocardia barduliensis]|uniref:HD domain-containing protein n=1 Tax=Nocardia barduliensis TaxID=2736643 RepID=UPI001572DCED|nr:HD domain-containing protein [Nocardia barduliensis]
MPNDDSQGDRLLEFMTEAHNLTRLQRAGWVMAGVSNPESVADHCFEAAMWAVLLAQHAPESVDIGKVLTMLLFHEIGEARLTDLPRRAAPYVKGAKGKAERDIANDLFDGVSDIIVSILEEFHARQTPEARIAEAAEELQIIFAALMYAKEGNGDITEYRDDVKNYPDYGVEMATKIAEVIGTRLDGYLGDKPYWKIGYRRRED